MKVQSERSGWWRFISVVRFIVGKAVMLGAVAGIYLAISIATVSISALASMVVGAAKWLGIQPVVSTVYETTQLRDESRRLRRSNKNLANRNSELRGSNQELRSENRRFKQATSQVRKSSATTAKRISRRTARAATRSVAAIPLESVPLLGASTIVLVTAWELRDACFTVQEMNSLLEQLGLDPEPTLAEQVCGSLGLGGARVRSYGNLSEVQCRKAAEEAKQQVLELADEAREMAPDLMTGESEYDENTQAAASAEFEAVNEICDCIADLACDPEELSRSRS